MATATARWIKGFAAKALAEQVGVRLFREAENQPPLVVFYEGMVSPADAEAVEG